ncbi:ankyrin repeats (3 copies) domain-containing protein [Trichoderma breve]|uniref:Ankyrin repeats (3 copies) domain-containing protein n=1 Tax=Trichoderma breve TaxID=2034170 RepID=A0A9W9BIT9_9HYPO|nr:ankyrin repeats (3 copies) domain-containing protein [Trichoderma breve]KAJ4860638.1 ankyrin repeats (3 copies) domain-containing protein [Trichoderma breve]
MEAEYSLLWLYGSPGCGKSILMSRVIECIHQNQFSIKGPDAVHLLYYYVGFHIEDNQSTDELYQDILTTFWEQTLNESRDRSTNTYNEYSSLEEMENFLHEMLISSKRDIYMVIDALDQLPDATQERVICGFNALARKLRYEMSSYRLSVAISSRHCNCTDELRTRRLFLVQVTAEKNRRDIEQYLEENLRSALLDGNPQLKGRLLDELTQKADGIFLWVILQASNISQMKHESQVMEALLKLSPPRILEDLYKTYAYKFKVLQNTIEQQIVQRAVALLASNMGSMSKDTLCVALSLDSHGTINKKLHQDLVKNTSAIVTSSEHLIQFNEHLGTFQFCHITAFEFFRAYEPAAYNLQIAELCLSYLRSLEFGQSSLDDASWRNTENLESVIQNHPFLPFVSSMWAISIQKSFISKNILHIEKRYSTVLDLFQILFAKTQGGKFGNLQLAFQVHLFNMGKRLPVGVHHEHIVSYYGLTGLFDIFVARKWFDVTKLDNDGLIPIHWALRNSVKGYDTSSTVAKLIQNGANINAKDKEGHTPLHYAARYGNFQAVKLLVEKAELNFTNAKKETALVTACRKHHEDVILRLVKAGADVKVQSSFGTALQVISLIGCCRCANAILARYGDSKIIIEKDWPFGTSLHSAAFYGHLDLVRLLCSKRIDIRATHKIYGTPVTAAVMGLKPGLDVSPFLDTIKMLLKHGVKVNDRSGTLGPALRAAVYHGNREVVILLLENGAKISKAGGRTGTAYEVAKTRGHTDIMHVLSERGKGAPDYDKDHDLPWQNRQQVLRQEFRATSRAGSMEMIDRLIRQFEKSLKKEIQNGETIFLKALVRLGKDAFIDMVELATMSHNDIDVPTTKQDNNHISRLRDDLSEFLGLGSASKDGEPILTHEAGTGGVASPHIGLSANTLVQGSHGKHFPQVLYRMALAAVNILDTAIATNDRQLVRLITNTWAEALNNLVSHPGLGEPVLEMAVQRRANELKRHLLNEHLSLKRKSQKAETSVLPGIELLLVAVERGKNFRHLSLVICKLWMIAMSDLVGHLGKAGEAPMQELIRILAERLSVAVKAEDQLNAEVCGQAGIELLRAAALSPRPRLLSRFSEKLAIELGASLVESMDSMVDKITNMRCEEYQSCCKYSEHDEALGLTLAGLGVLCTVIKQGTDSVTSKLLPFIESRFEMAREAHLDRHASTSNEIPVRYLEVIFDATVDLFAVTEEIQPGSLRTLALKIFAFLGVKSSNYQQRVIMLVFQRFTEAVRIVNPTEQRKQVLRIARTILAFADADMGTNERSLTVRLNLNQVTSGHLAKFLPTIVKIEELAGYKQVIEYLKKKLENTEECKDGKI